VRAGVPDRLLPRLACIPVVWRLHPIHSHLKVTLHNLAQKSESPRHLGTGTAFQDANWEELRSGTFYISCQYILDHSSKEQFLAVPCYVLCLSPKWHFRGGQFLSSDRYDISQFLPDLLRVWRQA
jgi:hypothetical protein